MKYFYIIIGLFVLILGIVGYLFFIRPKARPAGSGAQTVNAPQQGNIIPVYSSSVPPGDQILFGTAHGTVAVNNFYKASRGYDGDVLVIRQTSSYEILYNSVNGVFGIYITGGSVTVSRASAENDLLNVLGISREQVCYLNVTWGVSPNVDKILAGRNYPLSFCSKTN